MAKQIDLDADFNLAKVRTAGQLVINVLNRAYEIWPHLTTAQKKNLLDNSDTFKGIAKLKRNIDRFGGMGDGN